jgi:hypothetical protein|tara:strand:+ start:1033 stop:1899 length:867 start_codon:yes stop_codon:yes gene_type:complete
MKPQFDNQVMSSLLLWFDNTLLSKGEAFQNTTGQFYNVSAEYAGLETYSSSYSQVVADASITGATIPTGLYVGTNLVNVGEGGATGLYSIDYNNGRSYWSGIQGNDVTGSFAIKDFNTFLTNSTEDEILFQTQYTNRNKVSTVVPTGLEPGTKTYPVVYLKNDGSYNQPFAFGGEDNTVLKARAIVIADSQFEIDAIGSLFRDQINSNIGLFTAAEMPFNQYGYYRNDTQFNYTGVVNGKGDPDLMFLEDVNISRFDRVLENEVRKFNPNVYSTLIDFEINKARFPRQ